MTKSRQLNNKKLKLALTNLLRCVNLAENGNDTATDTDNNIIVNKRGPYKKLQKLHISHEIERLLLDGYSSAYIQQKLGLSERTYNRHRRESFLEQKECLLGLNT